MAASKHVRMLTHFRNAVPLVWSSLRLVPINVGRDYIIMNIGGSPCYYWGKPSMAALQKCVCIYACMFVWTDHLSNEHIQVFHDYCMSCPRRYVLQLGPSHKNEHEGLLPDCRLGVKKSESEDHLPWNFSCTN